MPRRAMGAWLLATVVALALALPIGAMAQDEHSPIRQGASLPATCDPATKDPYAKIFYKKSGGSEGWYGCTAVDTWTYFGAGGIGTVTHTGGALTAGKCAIGNGAADVSVDSSCALDGSGNLTVSSLTTSGINGGFGGTEGTGANALAAGAGVDTCHPDSTSHAINCSFNNDALKPLRRTVARGSKALATASIAANTCAAVQTDTATGALTTDVIEFTPNASIKAVTGYTPAGTLSITAYATADTVNFDVCNHDQTNAVTPGAVTLNWSIPR